MNASRPANRLKNCTSPYLQQHAHNPVDWYPWGPEALERAKAENRLIFLSIGYASCHWCHVMERESFEDASVAAFLNAHFVAIKVDREERPDLDAVYMEAVQLMTGSGGWPLNVWLTPDLRPVFGGTYFPPEPNYRLPSFRMVLERLLEIQRTQPDSLERQAGALAGALSRDLMETLRSSPQPGVPVEKAAAALVNQIDRTNGGFGTAPKFPNTMALSFMLDAAEAFHHPDWRQLAGFSLRQLYFGGIYDQLGGGLARYSTDARWLVPHFEKMQYDQALLIQSTIRYLREQDDAPMTRRLRQTLAFLDREMKTAEGTYVSAIDADSEGEEGRFYTWTLSQVQEVVQDPTDQEIAGRYFGLSHEGNWEGTHVLAVHDRTMELQFKADPDLARRVDRIQRHLFQARALRERPITDTKSILAWNALLLSAFCETAQFTSDASDEERVRKLAGALLSLHRRDGVWYRIVHHGQAGETAFLDDLALSALALLDAFETLGDFAFFDAACELGHRIMDHHYDGDGGFHTAGPERTDLPFKTRELFDNAVPGAFGAAVRALQRLYRHTGHGPWRDAVGAALRHTRSLATDNPLSFGFLMQAFLADERPGEDIVLIGPDWKQELRRLRLAASTDAILLGFAAETGLHPLAAGKTRANNRETLAWVCRDFTCGLPEPAANLIL